MAVLDFGGCAGKDDFAAVPSRARTNIDQIICIEHGVLVVFHHNDRVADVA